MARKLIGAGSSCSHLDDEDINWTGGHEVNLQSLKRATDEGCLRCAIIRAALDFWVPDCSPDRLIWLAPSTWPESLNFRLDTFLAREECVEIFVARDGEVDPHLLRTKPIPAGDTGSEASLQVLKGWLDNCISSHQEICFPSPSRLPTRVLEITAEDEALHVRLFVPTAEVIAPYVCLSHCWGQIRPACLTTRSTLQSHKEGIALDTMPKTFRDAISITHRLGFKYLWIDSMCILQDAPDDWQMESSKMTDIYRHAFLTIAATGAASGDEGLFFQDDPTLASHPINMGAFSMFVRKQRSHLVDQPLLTRAWTYQELLLSRRTVHFAKNELIWECQAAKRCECGGKQFPSEKPRAEFEIDWFWAVTRYSPRDMTFESDKFPALSGIAKASTEWLSGQKYCAGLWDGDLINGLLWERRGPLSSRPADWRAPTWSWASINGEVHFLCFDHPRKIEHASVTSVQCETIGDPTGRLKSATMTIRGPISRAILHAESNGSGIIYRWRIQTLRSRYTLYMRPDYDLSMDNWQAKDVFVFIVADMTSETEDKDPLGACLIIQREDDVYKRIGLVKLKGSARRLFVPLLKDAQVREFTFV